MAYIFDEKNNVIYLSQYHTFGRMRYSVDTVIERPDVSRFHAVIEWRTNSWTLKDVSTNGVWINQIKIPPNEFVPLEIGALIRFGNSQAEAFIFADSRPPEDILSLYEEELFNGKQHIIPLQPYHAFPENSAPTVVLYKNNGSWWVEEVLDKEVRRKKLKDRDLVSIQGVRWQLRTTNTIEQTSFIDNAQNSLEELLAEFNVSQDEESIQLMVTKGAQRIDLKVRNYHYLSLYLARRRVSDLAQGFSESEQGWVYMDQVSKDLGMEETTVNLHVHRARKQFLHSFENVNNGVHFIERRPSQLRLGELKCRILKANKLESETPCISNPLLVS